MQGASLKSSAMHLKSICSHITIHRCQPVENYIMSRNGFNPIVIGKTDVFAGPKIFNLIFFTGRFERTSGNIVISHKILPDNIDLTR